MNFDTILQNENQEYYSVKFSLVQRIYNLSLCRGIFGIVNCFWAFYLKSKI